MNLVEYNKRNWGDDVVTLFAAIYPSWDDAQCERIAYDEHHPKHIMTLLAVADRVPVGQINLFRVGPSLDLVNIGYHVHPLWQGKGIASQLLSEALHRLTESFSDGFVIQTDEENIPSKAVAIKSGFIPAPEGLIGSYRKHLKFLNLENGVCFHLSK